MTQSNIIQGSAPPLVLLLALLLALLSMSLGQVWL